MLKVLKQQHFAVERILSVSSSPNSTWPAIIAAKIYISFLYKSINSSPTIKSSCGVTHVSLVGILIFIARKYTYKTTVREFYFSNRKISITDCFVLLIFVIFIFLFRIAAAFHASNHTKAETGPPELFERSQDDDFQAKASQLPLCNNHESDSRWGYYKHIFHQ